MRIKKLFALVLSIALTLTSISALNVNLVVNAADTYSNLLNPDTTTLAEGDFVLVADKTGTVHEITQDSAGVKVFAQAP